MVIINNKRNTLNFGLGNPLAVFFGCAAFYRKTIPANISKVRLAVKPCNSPQEYGLYQMCWLFCFWDWQREEWLQFYRSDLLVVFLLTFRPISFGI